MDGENGVVNQNTNEDPNDVNFFVNRRIKTKDLPEDVIVVSDNMLKDNKPVVEEPIAIVVEEKAEVKEEAVVINDPVIVPVDESSVTIGYISVPEPKSEVGTTEVEAVPVATIDPTVEVVKEVVAKVVEKKSNVSDIIVDTQDIIKVSTDDTKEKEVVEDNTEDRFSLNNINSDDIEEVSVDSINSAKPEENVVDTSVKVRIGSTGDSKSIKKLLSINPGPNIRVEDSDEYQRAVIEQYITGTKGGAFVGPKSVTRVVLPYSGMFYDISSYTNSEMLGIHRSTSEISFIEKVEMELYSAWEHTVNNSLKRQLEFPEWLANIKYPDLWCIYWGIYNVNHPGINVYTSQCDYCPNEINEKRDNYDISYVSEGSKDDINQDDINNIKNGVDRNIIRSHKISNTLLENTEYLPEKKFKIFHGIPNMQEVLIYLKYLKTDMDVDDETLRRVLYPISFLNIERNKLTKSSLARVLAFKYRMYINKVYVPVYEEIPNSAKEGGKPKVKATYVNVKYALIPSLIDSLSKEDFKACIKGKELRQYMVKESINFRVKDSVCDKCGKTQLITVLDIRNILFTRAAQLEDHLINI